jgi:pimeloyl-ACP methyl ester carboxylesterase
MSKDDVEVRQTLLKDYELTTWELGEGSPLLFLHGGGGAANMFAGPKPAAFLLELAKFHRLIIPEHPGFGVKDRPAWLDNIHDLAYFYLDFLEMRGLRGVHLVGQSLGGWLALEIAVRDTTRLASLTVAGAPGIRVKGVPRADVFLWTRDDFIRNMFRNPVVAEAFRAHEPNQDQMKAMLRNNETLALLSWEPRSVDPHLHKWLHRIDVRTHVIWADDDVVVPIAYGREIARLVPGAKFSVVPQTGHLLHLDRPQAFSDAVETFIAANAA